MSALQPEFQLNDEPVEGIINTLPLLKNCVDQLKECDYIAVDVETTGLSPRDDELINISMAGRVKDKIYKSFIPIGFYTQTSQLSLKQLQILNDVYNNPDIAIIAHNAPFDVQFLRNNTFKVHENLHDTIVLAHLLNENRGLGLKDLSRKVLHREQRHFEKSWKGDNIKVAPIHEIAHYAIDDAINTLELYELLNKEIQEYPHILRLYNELEKPFINVIIDMESAGMYVDLDTIREYLDKIVGMIDEASKKIYELVGREFNVNSTQELRSIFESFGAPSIKQTGNDANPQMSIDVEVLNRYAEQINEDYGQLASLVLDYRKLTKLKSTYIDMLLEKTDKETSRVHGSFKQTGTKTGRLCVAGNTLLQTSQGTFEISKLDLIKTPNARILTHRGRYKKIVRKYYKGVEEMYDVRLRDGSVIRCTKGHRFLCSGGEGSNDGCWKHLSDLGVGDKVCLLETPNKKRKSTDIIRRRFRRIYTKWKIYKKVFERKIQIWKSYFC